MDVLLHLYASGLSFIEGNYEGRSFCECHVPSYAKGTAHLFTKQSKSENSLIGTAAPRFFLRAVVPGPFFRLTTVVSKRVPEDHSIYRLDEL